MEELLGGVGGWGLGIGVWGFGPLPHSPIPNPQSPIPIIFFLKKLIFLKVEFNI